MVQIHAQKLKQSAPHFFVLKNLFDTIKKVLFGQNNNNKKKKKKKKIEHSVCFNQSGH